MEPGGAGPAPIARPEMLCLLNPCHVPQLPKPCCRVWKHCHRRLAHCRPLRWPCFATFHSKCHMSSGASNSVTFSSHRPMAQAGARARGLLQKAALWALDPKGSAAAAATRPLACLRTAWLQDNRLVQQCKARVNFTWLSSSWCLVCALCLQVGCRG